MNRRAAIATLMSDCGLIGNLPPGQLDLIDVCLDIPTEVAEAISDRQQGKQSPDKGTRRWNEVRHFFTHLRPLGSRKRRLTDADRGERQKKIQAARGPVKYRDGQIKFKKYVVRDLIRAGRDFVLDNPDHPDGYETCAHDLAESMLTTIADPDARIAMGRQGWLLAVECAADHVYAGMHVEITKIARRKKKVA